MYLTFVIFMDMIKQRRALASGEGEIVFLSNRNQNLS